MKDRVLRFWGDCRFLDGTSRELLPYTSHINIYKLESAILNVTADDVSSYKCSMFVTMVEFAKSRAMRMQYLNVQSIVELTARPGSTGYHKPLRAYSFVYHIIVTRVE